MVFGFTKQKKQLFESSLPPCEIKRYLRQLILDDCTPENQKKIFNTKILVIGLGGLGIPVCLYLVGAGCKNIGIMDGDKIELSNLHRQIIFNEEDVGKNKAIILGRKLKKMNNQLDLKIHEDFMMKSTIKVLHDYDIIVDCSDNISTRYLVNDNSRSKIFICASVLRWNGEIYIFNKEEGCYRCLYPEIKQNPDTCNEAGIIGGICGTIGSMVSVEIIKSIFFEPISKLIIFDAKVNKLENVKIRPKSKTCPACNKKEIQTPFNLQYKELIRVDDKYKITWEEYYNNKSKYDLIDIRKSKLYKLAHVKGSRNIPFDLFNKDQLTKKTPLILCSRGISAQSLAKKLLDQGIECKIIKKGILSFKKEIDPEFPL